jgi:hypothetical protein
MVNIQVHRYAPFLDDDGQPVKPAGDPTTLWQGYIEPETRDWIMFVRGDGQPVVYLNRDPETGAVLEAGETRAPRVGTVDTGFIPGERFAPGTEFEAVEPPIL